MKESDKTENIIEEMANFNPEFKEGFSARVMEKIEGMENQQQLPQFNRFISWISLSGATAIILLLLMVYSTDGTLNMDAIYGLLNYSPDEPLLASLK